MNASKIIRKQAINKAKSSFNDKLKKIVKSEVQRELIQNDSKNDSNNINFTDKAVNKFASVGSKAVALLPLKWIAIGLACLLLLLLATSAISCVSSVASVGANATPNITPEVKEKIVKLMEDLDSNCGKKLSSGYTLEGDTNTDWRTVLALLFGYYKNDLTNFNENENVGGSSWKSGDVSENGLNMIKSHEGFSSIPYNLGDGTLTIGYGTTSRYDPINYRKLAPKCTELQASIVLQKSLKLNYANQVLVQINKSGREVTQYQFDALVSFQYNEGSIQDEKFWKMWCSGASVEEVAKQMEITKIGFGGGVVTRRKAEAHLFLTGEYPPVSIHDYGTGTTITTTSSVTSNDGVISKIYELINVVSPDHTKLNRKSFEEAIHELNLDGDQMALANALYEGNMWEEVFGEGYDFSFKINGSFSGGGNSSTNGVQFINGERKGNQKIVDLMLAEVGNNGDKYCDYYGLSRGNPYCAMFVFYFYNQIYPNVYPNKTNVNCAYCPSLVEYWRSVGKWADGKDYENITVGDSIFFSWSSNGVADHIGTVVGRDETYVYTIEGNSTNGLVCEQKYRLDSSVILGYAMLDSGENN